MRLLTQQIFTFFTVCYFIAPVETCAGGTTLQIIDATTGNPISNATICTQPSSGCMKTDSTGRRSLPEATTAFDSVTISAFGYTAATLSSHTFDSTDTQDVKIPLSPGGKLQELHKLTVRAVPGSTDKTGDKIHSLVHLEPFELQNTPAMANDIYRILQSQPAVIQAGTGLDNILLVRGGHSRENCFIVDGIEFENISHFSYLASSGGEGIGFVDGSMLSSLDFYTGAMPVTMPPKLSSVIDMETANGSFSKRKHTLRLSIAGAGITTEGPVFRDKASYFLNFRYIDMKIPNKWYGYEYRPQFGDAFGKLTLLVNEKNTLNLISLFSFDYNRFDYDEYKRHYRTTNAAAGLRFKSNYQFVENHLLASWVIRDFTRSDLANDYHGPYREDYWHDNYGRPVDDTVPTAEIDVWHISDSLSEQTISKQQQGSATVQIKDNAVLHLGDHHKLAIGASLNTKKYYLETDYNRIHWSMFYHLSDTGDPTSIVAESPVTDTGSEVSKLASDLECIGYSSCTYSTDFLRITAGLRGSYSLMLKNHSFDPNVIISVSPPVSGTFTLAGGIYHQIPAELYNLWYKLRSLNYQVAYYMQSEPFQLRDLAYQRCWQGVFSWKKTLGSFHHIIIESYYKWYDREYEMWDPDNYVFYNDFFSSHSEDQQFIDKIRKELEQPRGNKKAYGIEFTLLKKKHEGFYYALSYTWFSIQKKYGNNKWYDDQYNLRNSAILTTGMKFNKHHHLSLKTVASEGRIYLENLDWHGIERPRIVTERLDPILSVSLRYQFSLLPSFANIDGYIEIWNLLNYKPVIEKTKYDSIRAQEILPIFGLTAEF